MDWKLEGDRFLWSGAEGIVGFTATRRFTVPAGTVQPDQLRRLVERLGIRPSAVVAMEQVHGGTVRVVESEDAVVPGCDGLITDRPGVLLTMRSADCLPIIAVDPGGCRVGLAHAGWRGVRAGLPSQLVRAVGSTDLRIGIGPGIGSCCYEVGPEFESWFPRYLQKSGRGRTLDLKQAAVAQLVEAGVAEDRIAVAPWCTSCSVDHCVSYRRDGAVVPRMMTCAMIALQ